MYHGHNLGGRFCVGVEEEEEWRSQDGDRRRGAERGAAAGLLGGEEKRGGHGRQRRGKVWAATAWGGVASRCVLVKARRAFGARKSGSIWIHHDSRPVRCGGRFLHWEG